METLLNPLRSQNEVEKVDKGSELDSDWTISHLELGQLALHFLHPDGEPVPLTVDAFTRYMLEATSHKVDNGTAISTIAHWCIDPPRWDDLCLILRTAIDNQLDDAALLYPLWLSIADTMITQGKVDAEESERIVVDTYGVSLEALRDFPADPHGHLTVAVNLSLSTKPENLEMAVPHLKRCKEAAIKACDEELIAVADKYIESWSITLEQIRNEERKRQVRCVYLGPPGLVDKTLIEYQ